VFLLDDNDRFYFMEIGDKKAPTEFNVALHGESYHVKVNGAGPKNRCCVIFISL
jgi:hypothetical protein